MTRKNKSTKNVAANEVVAAAAPVEIIETTSPVENETIVTVPAEETLTAAELNDLEASEMAHEASAEPTPEHHFDEAAAAAALSGIDYAPIAMTTWGGSEENPDAVVDEKTEESADQFVTTLAAIDKSEAIAKAVKIGGAIDEREAFEERKSSTNSSIKKTLSSARKALTLSATPARVFIAANVDESFINRTLHEGSKYNVYAIGKLADLVVGAGEGVIRNAINMACMKSLFACRKAGVPFTMDIAKACASDKIRTIDPAVKKILVRHTVSESTAPTQASSTMQALATLGVVSVSGSGRNPTYTLTDAPITKRLEEVVTRAA